MEIRVVGSADMNSVYMSASYLINGCILLDVPGGVFRELRRHGVATREVKHVLITHRHGDHTLDLPLWLLQKTKQVPAIGDHSLRVYTDGKNVDSLKKLSMLTSFSTLSEENLDRKLDWHTEDRFEIDGLKFERIPVTHGSLEGCCGFLVSGDGKTVGFTGDSCMCEGVKELASRCDVLFCDCDLISGNEKHMGVDELRLLKNEFHSCHIIATHLKDETRARLNELGDRDMEVAVDGAYYEF